MAKKTFEPIAIVGSGCILPGADNPQDLWNLVVSQQVVLRAATERDWHIDPRHILKTAPGQIKKDAAWTSVGGYLNEISPFTDDRFGELDPDLDDVFHLTAHAVRQALEASGWLAAGDRPQTGLIMGNLGYAVPGFTDWTAATLLGKERFNAQPADMKLHPANRFMSALPVYYAANLFGLNGPRFALDAACASGLYAIKHACDYLQARTADVMVAGGINHSDLLHVGFAALGALSHTGQSRPFNQAADGLIPARGVAVVVLKRLQDAIRDRDRILGVIRGIGLSNDGRAGSFLSPSGHGQLRALRRAYESANIDPKTIHYIECHATGTQLGDATEIKTLGNFFAGGPYPKLGALKGCIGHTVTASGAAGLLKVLGAIEHDCLPGTPNVAPLNKCLAEAPFEVLYQNQPWSGSKRAGVSSFGFGGNNAHLIVEAWDPNSETHCFISTPANDDSHNALKEDVQLRFAVVGLAVRTHRSRDYPHFREQLHRPASEVRQDPIIEQIELTQEDVVFPPTDLRAALGQQLLIAHTASQVLKGMLLDPESTGIYIGMQCDGLSSRHYLRKRLPKFLAAGGLVLTEAQLDRSRDAIFPPCLSAQVLGAMPNIVTNRLNHQFSLEGQSHSIFAEELSGDVALEIALQGLARGDISTALVGAVDMCREASHQAAAERVLPAAAAADAGDAAVVLIVKRLDQARADQDTILAELTGLEARTALSRNDAIATAVRDRFGHAHCAQGLLQLAAGMALANPGSQPNRETLEPLFADIRERTVTVGNQSFAGDARGWQLRIPPSAQWDTRSTDPQHRLMRAFAADSPEDLRALLDQKQRRYPLVSGSGGTRAIVLGTSRADLDRAQRKLAQAIAQKPSEDLQTTDGVFRTQAIGGELAVTFPGTTVAYPGAGVALIPGFPP
ncbi:MAG: hypothetical protein F6J95_024670 [Leptolyngbya sp. SIO1E4]|nr:hypothetical protein [Leptolyngbya sp. SIO1E4]